MRQDCAIGELNLLNAIIVVVDVVVEQDRIGRSIDRNQQTNPAGSLGNCDPARQNPSTKQKTINSAIEDIDRVVADYVLAIAKVEHISVVADVASQDVIATAANQHVVAALTVKCIVALSTSENVCATRSGDGIVTVSASSTGQDRLEVCAIPDSAIGKLDLVDSLTEVFIDGVQ